MTNKQLNILVVDDNPIHLELTVKALRDSDINCHVDSATSGEGCLKINSERGYDIILLDHSMPQMNGLEVLERIEKMKKKEIDPPAVVMVTGSGNEEVAVEAMKRGAYDYVIKEGGYLLTVPERVKKAVEHQRLKMSEARLSEELLIANRELKTRVKALEREKHNLETMNNAVIDRELKMVELKKEINSLSAELGRPKKYG